jgi:GH15 family glucan-1,4-alpha-glucosidase
MATVDGEVDIPEWTVDTLPGYRDSSPVRVGNEASSQRQVDSAAYPVLLAARLEGERSDEVREMVATLVEQMLDEWRIPGHGLWEERDTERIYTQTLMIVAVALRAAAARSGLLDVDLAAVAASTAEDIAALVLERGVNGDGELVKAMPLDEVPGRAVFDAAVLQPLCEGFLPPEHRVFKATVNAVFRELEVPGGLRRYEHSDGLPGADGGAFCVCTGWGIHALALLGRPAEASALLDAHLSVRGRLGVFTEEAHFREDGTVQTLGNTPQTFVDASTLAAILALAAVPLGASVDG